MTKITRKIAYLLIIPVLLLIGWGGFGLFSTPHSRAAQFGGSILYTRDHAIWVWRDGDNRRITTPGKARPDAPATDPNELETQPAWAADGSKFAYVRYGDSYADIFTADTDGSNLKRLTHDFNDMEPGTILYTSGSNWAFAPAWRPDGERIAYLHDKGSDPLAVWVMASGGADLRDVRISPAEITAVGFERPAWSPDGNTLLATNYLSGKGEIWAYSFDSGEWRTLIKSDEADYDAAWSPDGKYIAYTAKVGGKASIWVANADGSNPTRLISDDNARTPAWSPDGRAVGYLHLEKNGFDLYAVGVDTSSGVKASGGPQRLTSDQRISGTGGLSWGKLYQLAEVIVNFGWGRDKSAPLRFAGIIGCCR